MSRETPVSWYIIVYKMIFGLAEFITGISLAFLGSRAFHIYQIYLLRELSEDPHDLLARLTVRVIPSLFTHNTLLVIYLLVLGAAKIAGAVGLIYHRNWGVDLLVGLTAVMFPFQFVNLIRHPSLINFLYISVGLLIAMYLIDFRPRKWAAGIVRNVRRRHLNTPVT